MSTLGLRAFGRTIALDGPELFLATALERLPSNYRLSPLATPERRWAVSELSSSGWAAAVDDHTLAVRASLVDTTEIVLSDLELWIAEYARRQVFVHAGCVAVDGHAILLPGRSMSGKSSLTAALVRAGAEYYSDEYAVLDSQGLVRPYPRALSIRPHDGAPRHRVTAEELGGKRGRGPATVEVIAALRLDRDASWQTEAVTRGPAVLRLLDNTVAARSRPRAALSALESATQDACVLEGTRGDADEAAARLLSILNA